MRPLIALCLILAACGQPRVSMIERVASCEAGFDGPVVPGVTLAGREVRRIAPGPLVFKVNAVAETLRDGKPQFRPVAAPRVALSDTCNVALLVGGPRAGRDIYQVNADRLRPERAGLLGGQDGPGVIRFPAREWWMVPLDNRERYDAGKYLASAEARPEADPDTPAIVSFVPPALLIPLR